MKNTYCDPCPLVQYRTVLRTVSRYCIYLRRVELQQKMMMVAIAAKLAWSGERLVIGY